MISAVTGNPAGDVAGRMAIAVAGHVVVNVAGEEREGSLAALLFQGLAQPVGAGDFRFGRGFSEDAHLLVFLSVGIFIRAPALDLVVGRPAARALCEAANACSRSLARFPN